jgi:hypothetical protein
MNYELEIKPGGIEPLNGEGDFFAIVSAPLDILVRYPGQSWMLFSQGDDHTLAPGRTFPRLEVRNPSTTATIRVILYAGFGRYGQRRIASLELRTEIDGWNGTQLGANAGQTFSGVPSGNRVRRKAIVVSNGNATQRLELRDSDGHRALIILPGDSVTLPVSETVTVFNPNGAPTECAISEIWWLA